jgi:hypothetical protein
MRTVVLTIPLERSLSPGNYRILAMHEYQNLLFLTDLESGVLIFDNLGNYIDRIELKGLKHISFYEEEIIASASSGLQIINIYTGNKLNVPLSFSPDMAFQNKHGYRIFKKDTIYELVLE